MNYTIKKLKQEIRQKQKEQREYINEYELVTNSNEFNELMADIKELHVAVKWIERMVKSEMP